MVAQHVTLLEEGIVMAAKRRTITDKKIVETIEARAISFNGATWALPEPNTHQDIGNWILKNMPHLKKLNGTPGYVTSKRRFVNVEEAKEIAEKSGQVLA